jgi:outer membrane receptor for ferrienterochelin and colicins
MRSLTGYLERSIPLARLVAFICCVGLSLSAGLAQAGKSQGNPQGKDFTQMSLEELLQVEVVSASKFKQTAGQAPSSVTIITSEEIRNFGYRKLSEILRSARGFYFNNDRNYDYLGVRGFSRPGDYNTRILLLINGHRLNDPVFDSAYVDLTFPVDVDAIDRVEIIRGPSSSLYGTNAFFGVINVITRTGEQLQGAEAAGEVWSYDTLKGSVNTGVRLANGLDVAVSGSMFDSKGQDLYFQEFDDPETNGGMARGDDYEKASKVNARLSIGGISFQGGFSSRKKGIPTGSFETIFGDSRTSTVDEIGFFSAGYGKELNSKTRFSTDLYFDHYSYRGTYAYRDDSTGADYLQWESALGERWGAEAKIDRKISSSHLVSLGMEYRSSFKVEQKILDYKRSYLDDDRSTFNTGIYIQDEIKLHPKLTLNLGLRHDHYESFGGTTNPRLAAIYSPEKNTTFKILYGQAYRAPNAYELYYQDGFSQVSNPELKPETIKTAELIMERKLGRNFQFIASGYRYWINDLISQQRVESSELLKFMNLDDVSAFGLDVELAGKWKNGIIGHASYSLQKAHTPDAGENLTNSPRHMLKLHMSMPVIREKLYAGLEADFMSRRDSLRGIEASGRWLTNVVFSTWKLPGGFDLTAGIYNLFDQRYGDPASGEHRQALIYQDGRNFRVRLSCRFGFSH